MKNISAKTVEDDKEYVTKSDLREIVSEIVNTALSAFAEMMAKSFSGMNERINKRFDKVEDRLGSIDGRLMTVENTMATKQDILTLHDKFVPNYKFDELSLRVHSLEENNNA